MELFWRARRKGERLILSSGPGQEEEVGGVRETKTGFDAFAKTFGYDPGRAQKDIPSMNEAKSFVEAFRPWELFTDIEGLEPESEVRSED
ncbi:MAG: hypothetical protein CL904_01380 [Dehalococcoidia bacterium]|nr:hypothetical protein [Dehalococcoidia bacterium]MQG16493.1 hypothetical protein [SAR202 cluster bacterium]